MELTRSVGPLGFEDDGQYFEVMRFTFETLGATCTAVSTYVGTTEPDGEPRSWFLIALRNGEVVRVTEYRTEDTYTLRWPSRNGSDAIDISCGDEESTRLFAQQFWEPEY